MWLEAAGNFPRLRVLAQEGGVQVLSPQVLLTVTFLQLPPDLVHVVTLCAVSQQANDLLVYTTAMCQDSRENGSVGWTQLLHYACVPSNKATNGVLL